jgi:hypothetical protein
MHIVMLSGYAGSGKDTAGKILIARGFKRYAFADAVKVYSANLHGYPLSLTHTQEGKCQKVGDKTVRQLLIEDSANAKEEHGDPAYWAKKTAASILSDKTEYVVITDWRYRAELDHFRSAFPDAILQTIRLERDSIQILADPSEHDLDGQQMDITIDNSNTHQHF